MAIKETKWNEELALEQERTDLKSSGQLAKQPWREITTIVEGAGSEGGGNSWTQLTPTFHFMLALHSKILVWNFLDAGGGDILARPISKVLANSMERDDTPGEE